MGLFNATRTYAASEAFIPYALNRVREAFEQKGYRFNIKSESFNRTIAEVQRGGLLHQAVGLRNGLEIVFTRNGGDIAAEARVTLLENHVAGPAVLAVVVPQIRVPLAVTDGIGLLFDIGLDEEALDVVDEAYEAFTGEAPVFCTRCGAQVHRADGVCDECGYRSCPEVAPTGC